MIYSRRGDMRAYGISPYGRMMQRPKRVVMTVLL